MKYLKYSVFFMAIICCYASADPQYSTKSVKRRASDGAVDSGPVVKRKPLPPVVNAAPSQKEIEAIVDKRAAQLIVLLEKVNPFLRDVSTAVKDKITRLKSADLEKAIALAPMPGSINTVLELTHNTLDWLHDGTLIKKSTAVIACGALKDKFNDLIEYFSQNDDTRDINLQELQTISESVREITKDIPNPVLEFAVD